jgi:MFS family permease
MTAPLDLASRTKSGIPAGLLPLFFLTGIMDASLGSILALLAEIRAQFGISPAGIGLIGGSGFVTAVAAQIGLARLADRGHARALLNFGLASAALSMLVLAQAASLWEFVAGRLLLGLGEGAILPAARRTVIVRARDHAGSALGRLNAFQLTGFLIGPLFGSAVFELAGLRAVFFASLVMVLACVPLVARTEMPAAAASTASRVLRTLLRRRGMQAMICMAVGYYGSFGLFEAIWAILLADLGASQLLIGLNFTLFALPMILVAPFGGRLATRYGAMRVAFVAMAATIPFIASYGLWESVIVLTLVMMVQAVGDAVIMPASQLAVAEVSGEDIAAGQGLFGACGLAVAALVAFGGGAAYGAYGGAVVFAGYAAFMVLTLVGAYLFARERLGIPSAPTPALESPSSPPLA